MIPAKVHPNNAKLAMFTFCPVPSCSAVRDNTFFLCRDCWFAAPQVDRSALYAMQAKGQDVTTKLAKMVRVVECKRVGKNTVAAVGESPLVVAG